MTSGVRNRSKMQAAMEAKGARPALQPLMVDSHLPPGWWRKIVQRQAGKYAGNYDVYIYSDSGKKFRSRNEIFTYIEKNNLTDLKSYPFDCSIYGVLNKKTPSAKSRTKKKTAVTVVAHKLITKTKAKQIGNKNVSLAKKKKATLSQKLVVKMNFLAKKRAASSDDSDSESNNDASPVLGRTAVKKKTPKSTKQPVNKKRKIDLKAETSNEMSPNVKIAKKGSENATGRPQLLPKEKPELAKGTTGRDGVQNKSTKKSTPNINGRSDTNATNKNSSPSKRSRRTSTPVTLTPTKSNAMETNENTLMGSPTSTPLKRTGIVRSRSNSKNSPLRRVECNAANNVVGPMASTDENTNCTIKSILQKTPIKRARIMTSAISPNGGNEMESPDLSHGQVDGAAADTPPKRGKGRSRKVSKVAAEQKKDPKKDSQAETPTRGRGRQKKTPAKLSDGTATQMKEKPPKEQSGDEMADPTEDAETEGAGIADTKSPIKKSRGRLPTQLLKPVQSDSEGGTPLEEAETPAPVKRGRGRPRKSIVELDSEKHTESMKDVEVKKAEIVQEVATKRGRGRPRMGNLTPVQQITEYVESAPSSSGRSLPKNAQKPEIESESPVARKAAADSFDRITEEVEQNPDSAMESSAKRVRGRPRKIQMIVQPDPPPMKKKGRPRKPYETTMIVTTAEIHREASDDDEIPTLTFEGKQDLLEPQLVRHKEPPLLVLASANAVFDDNKIEEMEPEMPPLVAMSPRKSSRKPKPYFDKDFVSPTRKLIASYEQGAVSKKPKADQKAKADQSPTARGRGRPKKVVPKKSVKLKQSSETEPDEDISSASSGHVVATSESDSGLSDANQPSRSGRESVFDMFKTNSAKSQLPAKLFSDGTDIVSVIDLTDVSDSIANSNKKAAQVYKSASTAKKVIAVTKELDSNTQSTELIPKTDEIDNKFKSFKVAPLMDEIACEGMGAELAPVTSQVVSKGKGADMAPMTEKANTEEVVPVTDDDDNEIKSAGMTLVIDEPSSKIKSAEVTPVIGERDSEGMCAEVAKVTDDVDTEEKSSEQPPVTDEIDSEGKRTAMASVTDEVDSERKSAEIAQVTDEVDSEGKSAEVAPMTDEVDSEGNSAEVAPVTDEVDSEGKSAEMALMTNEVESEGKSAEVAPVSNEVESEGKSAEMALMTNEVESEGKSAEVAPVTDEVDSEGKPAEIAPVTNEIDSERMNTEVASVTAEVDSEEKTTEVVSVTDEVDSERKSTEVSPITAKVDSEGKSAKVVPVTDKVDSERMSAEMAPVTDKVACEGKTTEVASVTDEVDSEGKSAEVASITDEVESERKLAEVAPIPAEVDTESTNTEVAPVKDGVDGEGKSTEVALETDQVECAGKHAEVATMSGQVDSKEKCIQMTSVTDEVDNKGKSPEVAVVRDEVDSEGKGAEVAPGTDVGDNEGKSDEVAAMTDEVDNKRKSAEVAAVTDGVYNEGKGAEVAAMTDKVDNKRKSAEVAVVADEVGNEGKAAEVAAVIDEVNNEGKAAEVAAVTDEVNKGKAAEVAAVTDEVHNEGKSAEVTAVMDELVNEEKGAEVAAVIDEVDNEGKSAEVTAVTDEVNNGKAAEVAAVTDEVDREGKSTKIAPVTNEIDSKNSVNEEALVATSESKTKTEAIGNVCNRNVETMPESIVKNVCKLGSLGARMVSNVFSNTIRIDSEVPLDMFTGDNDFADEPVLASSVDLSDLEQSAAASASALAAILNAVHLDHDYAKPFLTPVPTLPPETLSEVKNTTVKPQRSISNDSSSRDKDSGLMAGALQGIPQTSRQTKYVTVAKQRTLSKVAPVAKKSKTQVAAAPELPQIKQKSVKVKDLVKPVKHKKTTKTEIKSPVAALMEKEMVVKSKAPKRKQTAMSPAAVKPSSSAVPDSKKVAKKIKLAKPPPTVKPPKPAHVLLTPPTTSRLSEKTGLVRQRKIPQNLRDSDYIPIGKHKNAVVSPAPSEKSEKHKTIVMSSKEAGKAGLGKQKKIPKGVLDEDYSPVVRKTKKAMPSPKVGGSPTAKKLKKVMHSPQDSKLIALGKHKKGILSPKDRERADLSKTKKLMPNTSDTTKTVTPKKLILPVSPKDTAAIGKHVSKHKHVSLGFKQSPPTSHSKPKKSILKDSSKSTPSKHATIISPVKDVVKAVTPGKPTTPAKPLKGILTVKDRDQTTPVKPKRLTLSISADAADGNSAVTTLVSQSPGPLSSDGAMSALDKTPEKSCLSVKGDQGDAKSPGGTRRVSIGAVEINEIDQTKSPGPPSTSFDLASLAFAPTPSKSNKRRKSSEIKSPKIKKVAGAWSFTPVQRSPPKSQEVPTVTTEPTDNSDVSPSGKGGAGPKSILKKT